MSSTVVLVVALALGTVALKITGPVLAGGREAPAPVTRVITLVAPALIASLVVAGTFTAHQAVVVDARAAGLVVGAVALWLRAPPALALLLAALTCALARALT